MEYIIDTVTIGAICGGAPLDIVRAYIENHQAKKALNKQKEQQKPSFLDPPLKKWDCASYLFN